MQSLAYLVLEFEKLVPAMPRYIYHQFAFSVEVLERLGCLTEEGIHKHLNGDVGTPVIDFGAIVVPPGAVDAVGVHPILVWVASIHRKFIGDHCAGKVGRNESHVGRSILLNAVERSKSFSMHPKSRNGLAENAVHSKN